MSETRLSCRALCSAAAVLMMPAAALPAVAGQTTATAAKADLTVVVFSRF